MLKNVKTFSPLLNHIPHAAYHHSPWRTTAEVGTKASQVLHVFAPTLVPRARVGTEPNHTSQKHLVLNTKKGWNPFRFHPLKLYFQTLLNHLLNLIRDSLHLLSILYYQNRRGGSNIVMLAY